MAKKPKLELTGEPEGGAAMSPLIGLAREDLIGAVGMLLRETATKPDKAMRHMQAFGADVMKIVTGKSELAPNAKDKRFKDAAWTFNPFYRAGVQYYLAVQAGTQRWIDDLELDELERNRARFVSGMILDALSPTNSLAGNPSAIKRAIDSGGLSLMKGLQNAYNDIVHNNAIVSQVDKRPFKIGENIAITPGQVVWRTEMMELIQYAPTTETVHSIPQLTVPPQINKAYLNDLTPTKSVVQLQLAAGIQPFLISWRNPGVEQGHWGLGDYVDAVIEAIGVICSITGSDKVNLSGGCSGGITLATILSKMAAKGDKRANAATLMVCVLAPEATDSEVGALVSKHGIELARQRSAKKGILDGTSLSRAFAWLRPNDLVWNYVVNNYLHGEDPPAFDILFWNNDSTNLPAKLHSDYLDFYETQPFAVPGQAELAGHVVDLRKVTNDLFLLAGVTDHITPWKACYRSTQLFGSKNVEFVLSQSGHIQAILNPPGNPKAKYFRSSKKPPATPEKWLGQAEEVAGSWWPFWAEWVKERAGPMRQAPSVLGNKEYPPLGAAPGDYAFG
ncbi:MAG: alpha/beta fold hydrolase [Pseudomonadota bacterium]